MIDAGLAYTDTSRDVEAIYNEMRKLGVTSGTTTEFTLHDTSTPIGSRQASITDVDNQHKTTTTTNDEPDAVLNEVLLPPVDRGICIFVHFY